jgi:hypothetical protein
MDLADQGAFAAADEAEPQPARGRREFGSPIAVSHGLIFLA